MKKMTLTICTYFLLLHFICGNPIVDKSSVVNADHAISLTSDSSAGNIGKPYIISHIAEEVSEEKHASQFQNDHLLSVLNINHGYSEIAQVSSSFLRGIFLSIKALFFRRLFLRYHSIKIPCT